MPTLQWRRPSPITLASAQWQAGRQAAARSQSFQSRLEHIAKSAIQIMAPDEKRGFKCKARR